MSAGPCPFCNPDRGRVFYEGKLVIGLWDSFPVTDGHVLLIPRRHVATWFDATPEEHLELIAAIDIARKSILARFKPDGFNLGVNIGGAAGQTIFHLHLHVIPRYRGDVEDPTGGVRNVIPAKGNYLKRSAPQGGLGEQSTPKPILRQTSNPVQTETLICGGKDPLLPHLLAHLDSCERVDMAVAFILQSGVDLLEEHLKDLLDRGSRIRLLTGDYLGITDPKALSRLLDLQQGTAGQFELRVFESGGVSFHPKAYIFYFTAPRSSGIAYVGSSNLSAQALEEGIEWNYRVIPAESRQGFQSVADAFQELFHHSRTRPVDIDWIAEYERGRKPPSIQADTRFVLEDSQQGWGAQVLNRAPAEILAEEPKPPPEPHWLQREALEALEKTRAEGNQAGLVVLATGLGKTWLAAFDCDRVGAARVLFVAHREEILRQSLKTFRRIRPLDRLGLYSGGEKMPDADILFASIQTLGRINHLRSFDPDAFEYIIVDEFHHASARSYRKLIDYFQPKFLLGLTATPERTDGGDLLALCGENLVYRCDLLDGIRTGLLCPFRYFGVPDEVDYSNIPWRSGRFNEESLTRAVATQRRALNALEQYKARAGQRTLAFCCSQAHADFMAGFFVEQGVRAAAVHSGPQSSPRASTLKKLTEGELDVVFAVDMFNEGVDLPNIDTVMMLRPTESRVLWLQQFGRGLRISEGKDHLCVIDYIGNHRTFLLKPQTLFGLGRGDHELAMALEAIQRGEIDLPPGCEAIYELEAINIIRALLRPPKPDETLRLWFEDFRESHGQRPTAVEAFHEGYNPRSTRNSYGSWLQFLLASGGLQADEQRVLQHSPAGDFLDILETTHMTRSLKMLLLMAMLNKEQLPGEIEIKELVESFVQLVQRSAKLKADVGADLKNPGALRQYLEKNPIAAWTGGKGTRGKIFFSYAEGILRTTFSVGEDIRPAFKELVWEIADWRLAEYLQRPSPGNAETTDIICKVSRTGGRPVLFLPDRDTNPRIPRGWTEVLVEGQPYEANFVKVAVKVLRQKGSSENVLSNLLRQWFGMNVGLPGTSFHVKFRESEEGLVLEPADTSPT
jgi:superfamily II DNA or RNA helicase/HKD family nuclease/diadenosine tetraphosphate (Ap4A) HIT family hydrolase